MGESDYIDPSEYARLQDEYEELLDEFMLKFLRRQWPVCIVAIVGVFQLLVCLTILGIDLPIILMFAPRWQVFIACWGFLFTFIASVSTLHSTRKVTWSKLKWAAGLNIIGGLAAALIVAFNVLFLVNPKICISNGGCNYLSYTYSSVKSYYVGEVVMGIFFLLSVAGFLVIFIKHGIGGLILFENIQKALKLSNFNSIEPSSDGGALQPVPENPIVGPGVMAGKSPTPSFQMQPGMMTRGPPPPQYNYPPQYPPPPGSVQRYPPPGAMPRYPPPGVVPRYPPPGAIPRYPPPGAMPRYPPPGAMPRYPPPGPMVQRPQGPMMMPRPQSPMQAGYGQPGPYPPGVQSQ